MIGSAQPRAWLALGLALALLALAARPLSAQGAPRGPAELIGGAKRARDERDLEQAGQRARGKLDPHANPHAASGAAPGASAPGDTASGGAEPAAPNDNPHGLAEDEAGPVENPHSGFGGDAHQPPPVAVEKADASLPEGTIRVRVLDANGNPAAGADVVLGVMAADNNRSSRDAKTGADGSVWIRGLAVGDKQAYRVNVPYQGAKYSSTPFRLPPGAGYDVQIRRLPVTHDDRMVVLYLGATSIELKDDRLKLVQEAQLLNLGGQTYVFPEAGALVALPKGFMAVQVQESMTDQHVAESKGEGVRVRGSLPPGEATLLWGFDLPLSGADAKFAIDLPWLTFAYRVIADAPPGMTLAVEGMPDPIAHAEGGRHFLVTEVQRKVGDPPFRRLEIALHGLPGPGPERWIAAAAALAIMLFGATLARRKRASAQAQRAADFEARKAELIARARELDALHRSGETGPEYHREQMQALTDELAALLFEQAERSLEGRTERPAPA